MEVGCLGCPGASAESQPAPRPNTAPMTGNPRNPAMSPGPPGTVTLVKQWKGEGKEWALQTLPCALTDLPEHALDEGTADRYKVRQTAHVVNLVKLHLTAFKSLNVFH